MEALLLTKIEKAVDFRYLSQIITMATTAVSQILDAIKTDNVVAYKLLVSKHTDIKSLLAHMNLATDDNASQIVAYLYDNATPEQVIALVDRAVLIRNLEIEQDALMFAMASDASI